MDIATALSAATVTMYYAINGGGGFRATFENHGEQAIGFGDTEGEALEDLRVTLEFNITHNNSLT